MEPSNLETGFFPYSKPACGLRALGPHTADIQAHPGGDHLSTRPRIAALLTGPPAPRNTFAVPTITGGYAREQGRAGLRLAGDPVESDPGGGLSSTAP